MGKKKKAIMTLIEALVLISLAGCAGKKVDYGVDTEVKSQNVVSSVKDIDTNTSFNDELTVNMGGTDEKVKITADIRVPECDTMSVTEVERIPCTKEFKEKVIKAYFGDSQVYYYDYAHMTKKELEEIIETLDRDNNSLSDDASEEILKWHDDMKTECTKALETAADVWTEATEYDSCDDFVGKIGDTWFHLQFSRPDDDNSVLSGIQSYPLEYSLGADDVVYSKSLNVFDYSAYNKFCPMDCPGYETGSFNVNEYGVYRFDIAEPVSIVKKQQKVELLPVSNIYKIARNELESHPDKYIVEADTQYRYLTLGYIRVKDSSDSQRFSYIPAWSLELLQRGEVESCPVFVNAIDGTVIEPEQIF